MKLFQKLVGRNKNGKRSPPESRPSSRQSSSNERRIPEFVGGDEADLEEISEDNSLSYSSPSVRAPLAAARLNDEDKGLILSDDLSISRPEDNDPNFPTPSNGRRTHSRNNFDYDDGRNSGYSSPIVGAPSVRSMPSVSSMPVPAHANDNVHRLYQAQSDHNLSRMESFRSIQSNVPPVPPSMNNNNNQSFHIPAPMQQQHYNSPPPPPPQSFAPPPSSSFSPQEIMEINRLMAIGYSYETALGMMGINGSPSMFPPPSSFPIPMPVPVPMPMMMPPPQYYPMMGSPYQPYYQPSPYQMAPPPMTSTPYSAAGRRDQFDESEMMLAIQRSIEEEDRRKQQMTDEERMVKEAVERANERAIQIALQRSFEEQYGPGSYQRYQEQQRLSRAMSAGDIPYNTHHPVSPSPRINRQGTFDFNMIHNYGSADVDEEANPLREAIEEQFDQNRPGVYYHSPTRPLTSTNTASPRHSNAVNHIPSFMQQANDSLYEIPAEH